MILTIDKNITVTGTPEECAEFVIEYYKKHSVDKSNWPVPSIEKPKKKKKGNEEIQENPPVLEPGWFFDGQSIAGKHPCEGCYYYDNPNRMSGLCGDTPCNWCPRMQPTNICQTRT